MKLGVILITLAGLVAVSRGVASADDDDRVDPRGPEPPVYVFMPPPPEAVPSEVEPPAPPPLHKEKLLDGGAAFSLGTLFFQPALGNTFFHGAGTPLGGDRRESFHHLGREVDLQTPLMWGGELSIHYMRRYFAVGLTGFIARNGRSETPVPATNDAAAQVNLGGLLGYGGGIELAGALPLGPVAFRAGGVIGARGFSMPMVGFEKTTCRSKRSTYPCYETATTNPLLFFEPRVRVEISPDSLGGLFFGGYVGMEVVGG